ncbi:LacI family DNA-binding transcriptional regulator [Georgenia halophila]|uniref:LacI family DNA-binding transcriptional regulator n=1 Tax=Georgenia halophila TaxID=620889 RepID=A0ABP8LLA8_9MICO
MATLSDVAALAGVSKATASRALGRPELVAPDTVARVVDATERLGFVPNRAARSLARGRTGIVAVVVPTLENLFFAPIIGGAQERAAHSDLHLTISVYELDDAGDLDALERLAGQVDGFLVIAPRADDAVVRAAGSFKPTVLVDRELDGLASVVADTARAFGALVEALVDEGHERIAYLGGPDGSWQNGQRTTAVRAAATEGDAELTVLGPYPATFSAGVEAVEPVLAAGASAVVPYATAIGLGAMFALTARGKSVPGDVTVSLESDVVDALGMQTAPAIDVDGAELGRTAMDLLVGLLGPSGDGAAQRVRLPVAVRPTSS